MGNEDLAAPIQTGQSGWMPVPAGLSDPEARGLGEEDGNKLVLLLVLIRVNGQLQCVSFCHFFASRYN